MPRTRPRDEDDDFDDEEYAPRRRRRDEGSPGSNMGLWLGVGLGGVTVVVVAVIALLISGRRAAERERVAAELAAEAERERAVAQTEQQRLFTAVRNDRPAPRPAAPPPARGQNWPKVVGKWQRPAPQPDDTGYPYCFEFRPDCSVKMTWVGTNGGPQKSHESVAEIHIDEAETLSLILHVGMGTYSYSFHVMPNGTLVLNGVRGELVFFRVK